MIQSYFFYSFITEFACKENRYPQTRQVSVIREYNMYSIVYFSDTLIHIVIIRYSISTLWNKHILYLYKRIFNALLYLDLCCNEFVKLLLGMKNCLRLTSKLAIVFIKRKNKLLLSQWVSESKLFRKQKKNFLMFHTIE